MQTTCLMLSSGLVTGVVATLTIGQSRKDEIVADRVEASEFVLRGPDSQVRMRIGVDDQGVVRVSATSKERPDAFLLSVFPDGRGALLFRDSRGRNRLGLSIREDGRTTLTLSENANIILHDEKGRNRAVVRVPDEEFPRLMLYNERMQGTVFKPRRTAPDS